MLHNGECIRASFLAPSGHICFTCSWRLRGKRRATLSPSYFLSSPSQKERYALAVCLDYLPSNQLSENWSDRFWGPVLSIPVADGEKRRRLESRQCCAPSHRRTHATGWLSFWSHVFCPWRHFRFVSWWSGFAPFIFSSAQALPLSFLTLTAVLSLAPCGFARSLISVLKYFVYSRPNKASNSHVITLVDADQRCSPNIAELWEPQVESELKWDWGLLFIKDKEKFIFRFQAHP